MTKLGANVVTAAAASRVYAKATSYKGVLVGARASGDSVTVNNQPRLISDRFKARGPFTPVRDKEATQ